MPPLAIAAGVAAAAGIGGAVIGASATKKAAKTAAKTEAANQAVNNALARENRDLLSAKLDPYNKIGLGASTQLNGLLGQGPYGSSINSQFMDTMDPGTFDQWKANSGYDWNEARGLKGIGINAGAGGWLQSGAAIKGALDFQSGLAGREWGNYRAAQDRYGSYGDAFANQERAYGTDQYNTHLNALAGQQNVGLGAVQALAGVGNNYTNQVTANNNSAAAAAANAALARGAANSQMYAGIGNALGQAAGTMFGGGGMFPPIYG